MTKTLLSSSLLIILASLLVSCVNARNNIDEIHSSQEQEMTVGIVQREIRNGMNAAEVAKALGSPNIVSKDDSGKETWIYDKIATQASYSTSSGSLGGLAGAAGAAGSTLLLGLGTGTYGKNTGASAVTQKTLTVIIKFNTQGKVESATYHSSRF